MYRPSGVTRFSGTEDARLGNAHQPWDVPAHITADRQRRTQARRVQVSCATALYPATVSPARGYLPIRHAIERTDPRRDGRDERTNPGIREISKPNGLRSFVLCSPTFPPPSRPLRFLFPLQMRRPHRPCARPRFRGKKTVWALVIRAHDTLPKARLMPIPPPCRVVGLLILAIPILPNLLGADIVSAPDPE